MNAFTEPYVAWGVAQRLGDGGVLSGRFLRLAHGVVELGGAASRNGVGVVAASRLDHLVGRLSQRRYVAVPARLPVGHQAGERVAGLALRHSR